MKEKEVLEAALSAYGSEIQRVVAIEELSELQKELCKSLRGQTDTQHIAEEIAGRSGYRVGDVSLIVVLFRSYVHNGEYLLTFHIGLQVLRCDSVCEVEVAGRSVLCPPSRSRPMFT